MRERQKTTASRLESESGTLATSQAVTRSLVGSRSNEWTVCFTRALISASPQPMSATTQRGGCQVNQNACTRQEPHMRSSVGWDVCGGCGLVGESKEVGRRSE
eukprot:4453452-Pleurochrysis_carterae.AAC.1